MSCSELKNPYRPFYIDGSDYDPMQDDESKSMEEMFDNLSCAKKEAYLQEYTESEKEIYGENFND